MKTRIFVVIITAVLITVGSNNQSFADGFRWSFDDSGRTVTADASLAVKATIYSTGGWSKDVFGIGIGPAPGDPILQYYSLQEVASKQPGFSPHLGETFVFANLYPYSQGTQQAAMGKTFALQGGITWWDPYKHDGTYGVKDEAHTFQFSVAPAPEPVSSTLFLVGGGVMGIRKLLRRRRV